MVNVTSRSAGVERVVLDAGAIQPADQHVAVEFIVLLANRKYDFIIFFIVFCSFGQPAEGYEVKLGDAVNSQIRENDNVNENINKYENENINKEKIILARWLLTVC